MKSVANLPLKFMLKVDYQKQNNDIFIFKMFHAMQEVIWNVLFI